MTSIVSGGDVTLVFEKTNETMKVKVEIDNTNDLINVSYMNFGTISYGSNQSVLHSLNFSTLVVQLPGINELDLYATFEQLD